MGKCGCIWMWFYVGEGTGSLTSVNEGPMWKYMCGITQMHIKGRCKIRYIYEFSYSLGNKSGIFVQSQPFNKKMSFL